MTDQPPVDNPEVDPVEGQGEPNPEPQTPEPEPWFAQYGFTDEASALKSFEHARRKISEQGRELNELKKQQPGQSQQYSDPTVASQDSLDVTFDQFVEKPGEALARASEMGARKALSEYSQKQEVDRMLDEAARREGVERWEVEEAYNAMQSDPRRAVDTLAAIAKMQRGGVSADAIRSAVKETEDNKARATQVTSTNRVPESSEPDYSSMDFPQMLEELKKQGHVGSEMKD